MVTRDNTGPDILLPGGATLQQSVAAVVCRYQQTECGPRASHCSTTAQAWSAVERSPLQWLERVTPCSRFLASWPLASRGKNAENAVVIAVTINYSHHSHSHCILILEVDMVTGEYEVWSPPDTALHLRRGISAPLLSPLSSLLWMNNYLRQVINT